MTESNPAPARPSRITVEFRDELDRIAIVFRPRDPGTWFLMVWLTIWTIGCVAMGIGFLAQPSLFFFLFLTPFWAAEIFVATMVAYQWLYREEIELSADGVWYQWSIFSPSEEQAIPLDEVLNFAVFDKSDSDSVNRSLMLNTVGQPLHLCKNLNAEELVWLAHELNTRLATWRPKTDEPTGETPVETTDAPQVIELRPPSEVLVPQPRETSWRMTSDLDQIVFAQRGRWDWAAVGGVLFINLFWNGIVGVFVSVLFGAAPMDNGPPKGFEWWVLFFFLIPFELVGAMMLLFLVLALLDPLRTTVWRFARYRVETGSHWLGIGRTRSYEIGELDRLELRRGEAKKVAMPSITPSSADHVLRLIDAKENTLCEIDTLTLAEACWMADVILRERTCWFRK